MKNVLVTAGSVYGPLDDNKIVSNRARGLWAVRFAVYLHSRQQEVTLLLPDTFSEDEMQALIFKGIRVVRHKGFEDYRAKCLGLAPQMDACVMAAAVVNWIPAEPFKGKMPTAGYKPGDIVQIPFLLAPRVIEEMRTVNPRMTLIGCKMLSGSPQEALIEAAYHVQQHARCHAVVANDLSNLRHKWVCHPDGAILPFNFEVTGEGAAFNDHLRLLIEDQHYRTEVRGDYERGDFGIEELLASRRDAYVLFRRVIDKYREHFNLTVGGQRKVFGSIAVRIAGTDTVLMTAREKHDGWESSEPVLVTRVLHDERKVYTGHGKATLNAPLLYRFCTERRARAVLHLHAQLPGVHAQEYAPAGTVRDSMRDITGGPALNIENHGFVAVLDPETLEILT